MLTRSFSGFEGVPRSLKRPLRHRLAMAPSPRRRSRRSILPVEGNSNLPYSITPSPFSRSRRRKAAETRRERGTTMIMLTRQLHASKPAPLRVRLREHSHASPYRRIVAGFARRREPGLSGEMSRDHAYPLDPRLQDRTLAGPATRTFSRFTLPPHRSRLRKKAETRLELPKNHDHAQPPDTRLQDRTLARLPRHSPEFIEGRRRVRLHGENPNTSHDHRSRRRKATEARLELPKNRDHACRTPR